MNIIFSNRYKKQYKKLGEREKQHTKDAISLLKENPFDEKLQNHALHGNMKGQRAISVSHDLRIVFVEKIIILCSFFKNWHSQSSLLTT